MTDRRGEKKAGKGGNLPAQLELLGKLVVTIRVCIVEIIQETTALSDHLEQATTGAVILLVDLQVLGQLVDALGQERNLNVGRTGVFFMQAHVFDRGFFVCFCHER